MSCFLTHSYFATEPSVLFTAIETFRSAIGPIDSVLCEQPTELLPVYPVWSLTQSPIRFRPAVKDSS